MAEIQVRAEREYSIRITGDWRGDLSPWASSRTRVAVISSAAMAGQIPPLSYGSGEVLNLEIPDGEAGKNPATLSYLWNALGAAGFTRSDLIVAIGGGTVTDVSGFLAATWLRGIDWIGIPTTLAGMVDASVGGKTGVNSTFGKNLIGAFHSPISVIIDPQWLRTLSDRDFAAGLAEVVKCGFIDDGEILTLIEGKSLQEIRQSPTLVNELILRSVTTKAKVVSEDFKESDLREILNYGHTFGHAIEKFSNYSLRHGEAVSLGMMYIAHLAETKGLITEDLVERHRQILTSLNLPVALGEIAKRDNWDALFAVMALDKKNRGNTLRFVAISGIGECTRLEGVDEAELKAAYEKVLS
jgi:3-dehydroquinate synthase